MDPQYLLKDEVEFELACRGYVQPGGFASALRLILRKMMFVEQSQEVSYEIKLPSGYIKNPNKDLDVCSNKLDTILRYISELNEKPDKQLYKRLVSRLSHIVNRLNLMEPLDEIDKDKRTVLIDKAIVLLSELENKDEIEDDDKITSEMKELLHKSIGEDSKKVLNEIDNDCPSTSIGEHKTTLPNNDNIALLNQQKRVSFGHDIFEEGHLSDKFINLPLNSTSREDNNTIRKNKLVPISQWGVYISGDGKFSVNAFIERVFELKDARNATDEDLWRHAIDFFKGDALIWFRANREYIRNWEELVSILKRTFQSPFYQEELLAEARSRTQGSNESVLIFVSVMQNLFNRLPIKITEREKISVIVKNLQPYFQRAVCRDLILL
ncbi:uncharacterized protein LOC125061777 [Pieris napi]|uniref:uncharacterized protein LOC125061777 n=1 Tax=Pieris napi TaxID=78633 RepID=UPI001FB8EFF6|nr:uncharacterized protein LOC125061777 [Pieris napi]